ncbi:MAG: winged helix-turn-helix transcriptional regulator [Gemmatimonadota bacterium]
MRLEPLDLEIIETLRKDARLSFRAVAAKVGVSTTTVSHRVANLLEAGIIKGFKPVLDYGKLGYALTTVSQIKAQGRGIPKIVEDLVKDQNLLTVYEITGEYDVLVVGKFRGEETMNREIKRLLGHPQIEGTNTSIVLSTAKEGGDIALSLD